MRALGKKSQLLSESLQIHDALKGIRDRDQLPCQCYNQRKGWMESREMEEILWKLNRWLKRETKKILLFPPAIAKMKSTTRSKLCSCLKKPPCACRHLILALFKRSNCSSINAFWLTLLVRWTIAIMHWKFASLLMFSRQYGGLCNDGMAFQKRRSSSV